MLLSVRSAAYELERVRGELGVGEQHRDRAMPAVEADLAVCRKPHSRIAEVHEWAVWEQRTGQRAFGPHEGRVVLELRRAHVAEGCAGARHPEGVVGAPWARPAALRVVLDVAVEQIPQRSH